MAMQSIEVTCSKCGHTYVATGAMIVTGLWRRCPHCTPQPKTTIKESMGRRRQEHQAGG